MQEQFQICHKTEVLGIIKIQGGKDLKAASLRTNIPIKDTLTYHFLDNFGEHYDSDDETDVLVNNISRFDETGIPKVSIKIKTFKIPASFKTRTEYLNIIRKLYTGEYQL